MIAPHDALTFEDLALLVCSARAAGAHGMDLLDADLCIDDAGPLAWDAEGVDAGLLPPGQYFPLPLPPVASNASHAFRENPSVCPIRRPNPAAGALSPSAASRPAAPPLTPPAA